MLRDYQIDICTQVSEAFDKHRSVMVQMPTGTGKTMVLASLVSQLKIENVLIVAHRRELIEQIKATIKRMKMDNRNITVESIQTISRRITSNGVATPHTGGQGGCAFSLVVIDEAHHALAKTYKMMWDTWPDAKFLGLTATPCRLNGKGFTDLFDILVQSWDIPTFIKEKWLSTYDFVSIKADSHTQQLISSLKKRGADGDYQVKEMDAVLNKRPSIERLYKSFVDYAHNKKGFVYAINIDHARSIAEYYQSQGVRAVAIDSHTPVKEREKLIDAFKREMRREERLERRDLSLEIREYRLERRESSPLSTISSNLSTISSIQVLVNVDIFSEGFDCPDVEFIQLARPTLSLAKYLQMVGRGLRTSKGKKNCMIIDNVGLYRVFGLPSQIWDWKSAFEGRMKIRDERLKSRDESLKIRDNHSSFIINQKINNEMYLVVSHEQLDATFEQQKKDDEMTKERTKLLNGVFGKATIVGRQLVELRDTRGEMPTYVDLTNMNCFRHCKYGKPGIVRMGGIDFLRYGNKIISRTRTPITLSCDRECITKYSFYTIHSSVDNDNPDCLYFYSKGYENGSNTVVFLHDEPLEYYWQSSKKYDGGLLVMSIDGCYYHVNKGMPKVYLGCADTEENKNRLVQTVHALIAELERKDEERKENYRRDVELLEYIKPYQVGMKWGLRGSDGRILAPPKYRGIKEQNDYFLIEDLPLHWGVMDKFGKVLVEPKHDKVEITPDGKAILTTVTGKQTVIDLSKVKD